MKIIYTVLATVALAPASVMAQGQTPTSDPLTGLALSPGVVAVPYNAPTQMPEATICTSKMKGNFYSVSSSPTDNAAVGPTVAWYASHLKGFTHVHGYSSQRSQDAFYNAGGTIVVIVTANPGPESAGTQVYSVAYESYQPGLKASVFKALATGNIDCR